MIARRLLTLCVLLFVGELDGFTQCTPVKLTQNTYLSISQPRFRNLVYLYTGDIESVRASVPFKPFSVHIIVGKYRAPLLGNTGYLNQSQFDNLMKDTKSNRARTDIWRDTMKVSVLRGESKKVSPAISGIPGF